MSQAKKLAAVLDQLDGLYDPLDSDYPKLLQAVHTTPADLLLAVLGHLLAQGADPSETTRRGETALRSCWIQGRWDAVDILLKAGADVSVLGLPDVHEAILRQTMPMVFDPMKRDAEGRTPFLFACRIGNLEAARKLLPLTAHEGLKSEPSREGPVLHAVRSGDLDTLDWVLDQGFDLDAPDRFGGTALMAAILWDQVDMARHLLGAGAQLGAGSNDRDVAIPPEANASSDEMVHLLISHGADRTKFDIEMMDIALGTRRAKPVSVTRSDFAKARSARPGTGNPEPYLPTFWHSQIRNCASGFGTARDLFADYDAADGAGPVWSFERFGRSVTELPDGRLVMMAGAHGDRSDADFCIYADVTIFSPEGGLDHFIYPASFFPPTDFHTATLMGDRIIVIGSQGYPAFRRLGETQVLALSTEDYSITPLVCTGCAPGWIHRHRATHVDGHIVISGGRIEPGSQENKRQFALDLARLHWIQVS